MLPLIAFLTDSSPSWLLQHGIEFLVGAAGLLMGVVFVIAGWRGSATKEISLKNDPRVKALLYGLGGFITALIADWKSLLGQDVNKTLLMILYGVPFVTIALLGPLMIAAIIWIRLAWLKHKKPEDYPGDSFYLAFDYFAYGYRYHRNAIDKQLELAREQKRQRLARLQALWGDAATNLAALILSPNPSIQLVLQNMCSIFKAHTEGSVIPEVDANVMVAIPFANVTKEQKDLLKFQFGDPNRYGHILWLKEYAYLGEGSISLPVEDRNRTPDWMDLMLLGAPEAFLRNNETVVNTKKLDFAAKIPETVQREMGEYFRGKGFKSFACFPVVGKGSVLGIVNIESSHELGSEEIQNEIAKILQPFCAVLSLIINKEENP
jgi:hypothetical protein